MPGLMMGITFTLSPPTLWAMSVVMVESEATLSSDWRSGEKSDRNDDYAQDPFHKR